ncbi:conserved hypothetical protein [Theileria orientalis strain Shintoku]|uniref:Uncharacterized protein n=1 Tax=Theileria orientalis strain Shintoku TaxID=869250 RepID=J4C7K8_THEOR|nr:conserved hypothetical protein [Theileria orientalis strain Shintoku]BAM39213.1 conserved hypothetical protein [Theileria orientalis strain Shintoku]|eukprot:XP_009689514.1 conserved hypothetical protein [Theileria orientalis strain Shintoku]
MDKVDVAYNHLLNWLCARGKLPNDYATKLLDLEDYCNLNILYESKLPEMVRVIVSKASEEYTEWYDPLTEAFELLKNTPEGKAVNFIGQYTFQPMQKVDKALKKFNKHNLYMVSYHQLLHKYVTYYIPFLKKNLVAITNELNDYKLKEFDSVKKFKNLSAEFEIKLEKYGLNKEDYEYSDQCQTKLYYDIQEKVVEMSTAYLKETYEKVVSILNKVYDPIIDILSSFTSHQKMEASYSVKKSTRFIRHCKNHGLRPYRLAHQLHHSLEAYANGAQKHSNGDFIVMEDGVKVDEELSESFLGNNICRQLLLSDLHELLIFFSTWEHQLSTKVYADYFGQRFDTEFHVDDCRRYSAELTRVVDMLMGNETVKLQNMLKNHQKLSEYVLLEMNSWSLALKELKKQESYSLQIRTLGKSLQYYKNELDTAKQRIKHLKSKLEEGASLLSNVSVHIFGEIDAI